MVYTGFPYRQACLIDLQRQTDDVAIHTKTSPGCRTKSPEKFV